VGGIAAQTRLYDLDLYDSQGITDASVPRLSALRRLEALDIEDTGITPAGVAKLRKALPRCRIRYEY
jgi:hypothetical protein